MAPRLGGGGDRRVTGFKTAPTEELPDAVAVMDPSTWYAWPVTRWTSAAANLLTDRQHHRLQSLFIADKHAELEATWGVYQHMIAA